MKKKFAACCLALMVFILGVWISGVAIVSSYSQTGMEVALRRCNNLLYSKFQSGVFLYKISLRYIPKQTDLFSQRGFVEINFAGTDKVYDVPVKIDHGFLTMDADFDFNKVIERLFVRKMILDEKSTAKGRMHVRLLPFAISLEADVKGKYTKYVKNIGVLKDIHGMTPDLDVHFLFSRNFLRQLLLAVECRNLYIPGLSADKIFFLSSYTEGDRFQIPKNARLYASGLVIDDEFLGQLKSFDVELKVPKVRSTGDFDIDVVSIADTRSGVGMVKGKIKNLSSYLMAKKLKSWTDVVLNPNSLNSFTNKDYLQATVIDSSFNVDQDTESGKLIYRATAKGEVLAPKSEDGISKNLASVKGKFDVKFDHMNDFGHEFVKKVGGRMLGEDKDSLVTEITIDKGKLIFSGQVF